MYIQLHICWKVWSSGNVWSSKISLTYIMYIQLHLGNIYLPILFISNSILEMSEVSPEKQTKKLKLKKHTSSRNVLILFILMYTTYHAKAPIFMKLNQSSKRQN